MSRFLPGRSHWAVLVTALFLRLLAWSLLPARAQARSVVWLRLDTDILIGVAGTAILLSVSLAVSGAAFLIVSRAMPVRTRKGAEARMRLVAFRRYLAHIEKYTSVQSAADQFNRYLPYAIAFGMERSWVNKFAAANAPAPAWFIPRRLLWETRAAPDVEPATERESAGLSSAETRSTMPAPPSRETGRLDVSTAARAGSEAPSLASVNQSLTMVLSRVNSDLINMFSSAAHVFDSRPPSPAVTALLSTASRISNTLTEWSASSSWSGGGSSGGGGGGFGQPPAANAQATTDAASSNPNLK